MARRTEDSDHYESDDNIRLKLMNNTLLTENDFLREELHNLQRKVLSSDSRRNETITMEGRFHQGSGKKKYLLVSPLDNDEERLNRVDEESVKISQSSPINRRRSITPSRPRPTDAEDHEVELLRGEVKRLRGTIDKLSRASSHSKSPSKASPYDVYYDRSPATVESMKQELEK